MLLRVALEQPNALTEWPQIERGVSSALLSTECLRTLDRLRLRTRLDDAEIALRRSTILNLIASIELVDVDGIVLQRAAQPMPTELGTLDAIHLATALLWNETKGTRLAIATHDNALGTAARAHGMTVIGTPSL